MKLSKKLSKETFPFFCYCCTQIQFDLIKFIYSVQNINIVKTQWRVFQCQDK